MDYKKLVSSLSPDEYLTFIIEVFFSSYQDKEMMLSVYDANKQLRFSTDMNLKLHGLPPQDYTNIQELDILKDDNVLKSDLMSAIDCVFSSKTHISGLVFVRFPQFVGVIHVKLTPLFHQDEVCGALLQKTISSRLVYSVTPMCKEHTFDKKLITVKAEQIKLLSEREGSVLFLSLLNYTMSGMAKLLSISEGTVRTYIARICDKFYIPNSLTYIQKNLEKRAILNSLALPDIKFNPISILTVGDNEHFLTQPSMELITAGVSTIDSGT